MKKYHLIYKTTNLLNGKIYIGKHTTTNKEDNYLGSGIKLINAIKKYGRENFKKEILIECKSEEELALKESEIVTEEFCKRKDVYNICSGGYGGYLNIKGEKGCNLNEISRNYWKSLSKEKLNEHIDKMRAGFYKYYNAHKEEFTIRSRNYIIEYNKSHKIKKHTEETKQKLSELGKKRYKDKNPMYEKMWIYNVETKVNKCISKTDIIPTGWTKGRIIKKFN